MIKTYAADGPSDDNGYGDLIVMCVCHFDDTNPWGGLERQASLLSQELQQNGLNILILSSTRKLSRRKQTKQFGAAVRLFWTYTTPQVSGRKFPASILWATQILWWTYKNRGRIKIFHSHQIRIHAFVGAIAQKLWGIPHVLKSATGGNGADIKAIGSRKYFGSWGRRFIVRNTKAFIATTETIKADLLRFDVVPDQILSIPNGLRIPKQDSSSESRWRKCLYLGRLDRDKNVVNLVSAAIEIGTALRLQIDIYGKGEDEGEVIALIQDANNPYIRYCGYIVNPHEILPTYGWLILPSSAEGLSNAMLEAMANGVIPVTTRVSGCVDHILPGETGYFLDGIDIGSLKQGIERISSTSEKKWKQMSGLTHEYARCKFDIQGVAASYTNLYNFLAPGR